LGAADGSRVSKLFTRDNEPMNGTMARHNAKLNPGLSALTWESSLKGSITHYLHEVIPNGDQLALK